MSNPTDRWRFPKTARLLQRRDFLRVYDDGDFRTDRRLWVYFLPRGQSHASDGNTGESEKLAGAPARIGITVPRKIGRAVRRNRLRRRIREIIRLIRPRLRPGVDIVINCSPRAAELEFTELQTRVVNLLAAAQLLTHDLSDDHFEKP